MRWGCILPHSEICCCICICCCILLLLIFLFIFSSYFLTLLGLLPLPAVWTTSPSARTTFDLFPVPFPVSNLFRINKYLYSTTTNTCIPLFSQVSTDNMPTITADGIGTAICCSPQDSDNFPSWFHTGRHLFHLHLLYHCWHCQELFTGRTLMCVHVFIQICLIVRFWYLIRHRLM